MLEHRNLTLWCDRERALICHAGSVFIRIWNLDYSGGNPESRTLSPESTAWSLECNTPLRRREERRGEKRFGRGKKALVTQLELLFLGD